MAPEQLGSADITVLVVYAPNTGQAWQRAVELAPGTRVYQAIEQSEFQTIFPDIDWQACGVGIFGKRVTPQTRVAGGDRIEIYRDLVFDPKESRRRRARHRQHHRQRQKTQGEKVS